MSQHKSTDVEMPDFSSKDFEKYQKKVDILASAFVQALLKVLADSDIEVEADLSIGLPASLIAWSRFSDGLVDTVSQHPDKTISKALKDTLYQAETSALEGRLIVVREKVKK